MNRSTILLSPLVPVLVVGLATAQQTPSREPPTDALICEAVEDELAHDRVVPARRLRVVAEDGIVTVSGTIDNLLAAERAVAIARTVRGVRAVVDRTVVSPPSTLRPEQLGEAVERALRSDPATDSYEVHAVVETGGAVRLEGRVESWAERTLSEKVAKGTAGVTSVDNTIAVDFEAGREDSEIRDDVAARFRWDILIDDRQLDVECRDGEVTLAGIVGSAAERMRAIDAAWVAGVKDVDGEALAVEPWTRDDSLRMSEHAVRSPEQIRDAVLAAMRRDPRVNAFDVRVEVDLDEVTLRGTVDNLKARRAAADDARNTVGVARVQNRLRVVQDEGRSNAEILADIEAGLERDPFVDRSDIQVWVVNGTARLRGRVDTNVERAVADDVAARVNGVVDVENHLVVRDDAIATYDPYVDVSPIHEFTWYRHGPPLVSASDEDLRRRVEDELWWSPYVIADDIDVAVDNGIVTLTGRVADLAAKLVATKNGFDGGAAWVDNRLELDRGSDG